jgi:hypothetical protein
MTVSVGIANEVLKKKKVARGTETETNTKYFKARFSRL